MIRHSTRLNSRRRAAVRLDLYLLALVTILLLVATIFITLKLLDQSERHVEAVHGMKVTQSTEVEWAPQESELDYVVQKDLLSNPERTVVHYRTEISEKGMKLIGQMHKLQNLDLSGCSVQDSWLKYIQNLPLVQIDLCDSEITDKGASVLAKIKTLTSVTLARCTRLGDEGISQFKELPHLGYLDVSGSGLTDAGAKELSALPELGVLRISETHVTSASLPAFAHSRLSQLDLNGLTIDPADLTYLQDMKLLRTLSLARCKITDADLPLLTRLPLKNLNISGTQITGKGLLCLKDCKALDTLAVDGCPNLNSSDIDRFKKAKPKCKISCQNSDKQLDNLLEKYGARELTPSSH